MMWNEAEMLIEGQQLIRVLDRTLQETARDFGLNKTELQVLLFLYENPEKDIAKNIADCQMLTKSSVSKAIDSLVKEAYLEVEEDQKDRRILHLIVREKALVPVNAGKAARDRVLKQIMYGISREEQDAFMKICQRMLDNLKTIM